MLLLLFFSFLFFSPQKFALFLRRVRLRKSLANYGIILYDSLTLSFYRYKLTHYGRVTQICVFKTRLVSTHSTLNYAIHGAFLRMVLLTNVYTRVGTLIVTTIYLQLMQNRYMFRSFTVLKCSHQHCVQPVASDVEVVGYL